MELTGKTLNGYLVGARIGGGGMGEVYQAYPPMSSEPVALKVLPAESADDPDLQNRFVREIRLMQSLHHPHIVPIYDYGNAEGRLYFTMRLISGPTLMRLIEKSGITPLSAWKVIEPICHALDYMHTKGIIHRDIKPSNIFLERDGTGYHVYLGDLGLGKNLLGDSKLTVAGSSVGTIEYMSPEALLGQELDKLADLYSFAVVVYEMLLGFLPFKHPRKGQMNPAALFKPPTLPHEVNPAFPLHLEAVLLRALDADKSLRYENMRGFAKAYHRALNAMNEAERTQNYRPQ